MERGIWNSDQARKAFDLAGDKLEPVIRKIGDDLIGSRELGINPNFARVLRSQILGKDRQWIVAIPNQGDDSTATAADRNFNGKQCLIPIVYLANPENMQLAITDAKVTTAGGSNRDKNADSVEASAK